MRNPLSLGLFALLGALLLVFAAPATAQELDCRVTVNYQQLTGTEYAFLGELADQIEIYLNQRSWTNDRFEDHERIACTFSVTIPEAESLDRFRASDRHRSTASPARPGPEPARLRGGPARSTASPRTR
jgi:hypothetical protein